MKTTNGIKYFYTPEQIDQLEEGQLKRIALHLFNGEELPEFEELESIEGDEEKDNYMVLTDEEADEKAKESIIDTLWAFNASFLAEQTGLDQEIFEAIQENGKCESNNDMLYNLIQKTGNIDDFVSDAIGADGRGHFLNTYDGEENEVTVNGETFYIYRMN